MANLRRGYSDDFTLKNNSVGIGTSTGQEALDVVDGSVKGQDLKVTGISSFTAYEGFLRADHQIVENTTLSFDQGPSASLSGEIIVGTGNTVTIDNLPDGEYGPELITNGTFDSNTTGWTGFNAVLTSTSNQLKVDDTANAGGWSSAVQQVTTEPGAKYRWEVTIGSSTDGSYISYHAGAYLVAGVTPTKSYGEFSGGQTVAIEFIAPEKITSIVLTANNDGVSYYDNVSLKKINDPEEPRAGGSEIECLKVYNTFTPPSGGTNERPYAPKPGELYYNYDFKTIEFFDGNGWRQVDNTTRSGRAVFGGGYTPTSGAAGSFASVMDYVNISTRGNAVNFGEMTAGTYAAVFGFSSATRGVFGGGYKNATSSANNTDTAYITIASEGNTIDFGNLNSSGNWGKSAHASSTRGLAMGGYGLNSDIDYVEIATLGNFLDFGDLVANEFGAAGMGSPTVALSVAGGPNGYINQVTIASKGNAILWGEADNNPQYYTGGGSNSVRGLFNKTRRTTTQVQSLIIASSGTIDDFGNLTSTTSTNSYPGGNGNCASQTTLLFAGGSTSATAINTIETITITTAGDATDFGDLTTKRGYMGACSDSHGGLGGF